MSIEQLIQKWGHHQDSLKESVKYHLEHGGWNPAMERCAEGALVATFIQDLYDLKKALTAGDR